MSLFDIIRKKIRCSIFQGASIELYEYCQELESEFNFVENAYKEEINNIYQIKIKIKKQLSLSEIDDLVFPIINFIRYHNGLFYERHIKKSQVIYQLITFRNEYEGFACKIIISW